MKLQSFLKKFLPEYQNKKGFCTSPEILAERYFDEALQNYTNLICEVQRKLCVTAFIGDYVDEVRKPCRYTLSQSEADFILNADQPMIKDLTLS